MPMTCDISRAEREAALAAGIDVPDAGVAIVVGSAQGDREYVQRIGRLLRATQGKRALIYELVTSATSDVRRATERRRALAPAGAAAR
jgi:superfamily II DNA or RNA helicase